MSKIKTAKKRPPKRLAVRDRTKRTKKPGARSISKNVSAEARKASPPTPTSRKTQPPKATTNRSTPRRSQPVGPIIEAARTQPAMYDASEIVDAPEFHGLARAMGVMTWGTWDDDVRPFEERVRDFLFAYPASDPVRHLGGRLQRQANGTFRPGDRDGRLERFLSDGWDHGSIHELLSRFGLKMKDGPSRQEYLLRLDGLKDVAKRRNVRLRVLHGGVDVEATNMDAAKAEYLDRQEKQQAARDVRSARAQMRKELEAVPVDSEP